MAKAKTSHSTSSANKLRERALELAGEERKAALELGGILSELRDGSVEAQGGSLPFYKFFGFKDWFDYVESEIGLHVSTAAVYIRVHELFMVRLKGKWDVSKMPPFTKLKALSRVVDEKNVGTWIRRANENTCCALEDLILEEIYGKRRKGAHRHFLAMLTDRQLTSVNSIIEIGRVQFPKLETRGEVLAAILEEWDASVAKKTKRGLRVVDGGKATKRKSA